MAKYTKRKDGRWQGSYYTNGKRVFVCAPTRKQLDEKLTQQKSQINNGLDYAFNKLTFDAWANSWLKNKKLMVSPATYEKLQYPLKHLLNRFTDIPISKIKNLDIQELIHELAQCNPTTGKPSSINTMSQVRDTAQQIFDLALQNQAIMFNPVNGVTIPTFTPPEERSALTIEEQLWIINTPHRAQTSAMIMMFAGLRRGELLALTWNDIDLKQGTINVNKTVNFIQNRPVIKMEAKTKDSIRTIFIPQVLIDYLSDQKKTGIYVSCNTKGNIHTETSWRRTWDSYLTELNRVNGDFSNYTTVKEGQVKGLPMVISDFTPHWLRHTFATMMHRAHVDELVRAIQMGHSSRKTMTDRYTHLDDEYIKVEIEKLNQNLKLLGAEWMSGTNKEPDTYAVK